MYSFNLIGSDRPLRVALKSAGERLAMPAVTENLEEWGLQDPLSFFSLLLMKNETVQAYTAGARSIRDDRTIIDYSNPKSIHSSYGLVNILSATRELEEHLDTNPYISTAAKFAGGGFRRLVELTQQTDYVGDIIDWEGFTPEERLEAEARLREQMEGRKNLIAGYLKPAGGAAGP